MPDLKFPKERLMTQSKYKNSFNQNSVRVTLAQAAVGLDRLTRGRLMGNYFSCMSA